MRDMTFGSSCARRDCDEATLAGIEALQQMCSKDRPPLPLFASLSRGRASAADLMLQKRHKPRGNKVGSRCAPPANFSVL